MPIVRDFVFETDADSGLKGLRPLWLVEANPTPGIAHDLLEHRMKEKGSAVTAELQAIGAILALRIENGAFFGGQSHAQILANIIFEMLLDLAKGKELDVAGHTRPLREEDEWAEALIQQAVPMAVDMAESELRSSYEDFMPFDRGCQADIIAWVRRGYRYTQRRYRHRDRYSLGNRMFNDIDKASAAFIRDEEYLAEGDRVRVSFCPRFGTINFKVNGAPVH